MHSPDHSTKGTPSGCGAIPQHPLTACAYAVSGTLSSPSRGAFHLSLTVLVPYRSLKVFSLGGWSPLLPTNSPGFVVLRIAAGRAAAVPTGLSPAPVALSNAFGSPPRSSDAAPTTPAALSNDWFGLFPPRSPLLRESRLISLRRATEMFQFTHCPPPAYVLGRRSPDITLEGLPHSDSQGSTLACSSP